MKFMAPFLCASALAFGATFVAAPAFAAGELCLSAHTGGTCSDPLTVPVGDPAMVWVPGDSAEASFFASNQTSDPAVMDISVLSTEDDSAEKMLRTGELRIAVRVNGGAWHDTNLTGLRQLIANTPVGPGEEVEVSIAATFPYGTTAQNDSQDRHLDLTFLVRLTQFIPGAASGSTSGSNHQGGGHKHRDRSGFLSGFLPSIGASSEDRHGHHHGDGYDDDGYNRDRGNSAPIGLMWWLLPAGFLGVASGWLTVFVSRRREERHVPAPIFQV